MTRYIVKGFTACNQHLFAEVVEAPTKTLPKSIRSPISSSHPTAQ